MFFDISTNGTYLGKELIGKGKRQLLSSGTTISLLKPVKSISTYLLCSRIVSKKQIIPQCFNDQHRCWLKLLNLSIRLYLVSVSRCEGRPPWDGRRRTSTRLWYSWSSWNVCTSIQFRSLYQCLHMFVWQRSLNSSVCLFSGNFATVKLAIHKKTGEKFAIKIIDKKKYLLSSSSKRTNTLMDEVNILKRVSHPNVHHYSLSFFLFFFSLSHIHFFLSFFHSFSLFLFFEYIFLFDFSRQWITFSNSSFTTLDYRY